MANRQRTLDLDSVQRERWATIRSLLLPPSSMNCRIQFLVEIIEGLGKDGQLQWSLDDLSGRMRCPYSTLRETIAEAARLGLIAVSGARRPGGQYDRPILANSMDGMRAYNANQRAVIAEQPRPKAARQDICQLLQSCGLATWNVVSADLEQRQIPLHYVEQVVSYWRIHRDKWIRPEGVLSWRLRASSEALRPEDGWPPRSTPEPPRGREYVTAAQLAAEVCKTESTAAVELERVHGGSLDAMARDELKMWGPVALRLADNPPLCGLWKKYLGNPQPGLIRTMLLESLHAETQAQCVS